MEQSIKDRIDKMDRVEMARMIRFGESSDLIFHGDNYKYFLERFNFLGGMSPEISKKIGR